MNTKSNSHSTTRSVRPLVTDYNKINEMEFRPKRERKVKRKYNYTKTLSIITAILVSLLIVCVYYLFQKDYHKKDVKYENEHCMKKDCLISASFMIKSMDNSFYPCDDFFLYSCGHSLDNKRQTKNDFIKQIESKHQMNLKNSIESLNDEKQPNYIRKVYKYYKSCLNEALIDKQDLDPLIKLINRLGGWPVVKKNQVSNGKQYHWLNTYIMMRKIGVNPNSLFKLNIERDVRNNSRFIAYIDQPEFVLTRDNFFDSDQYFNLMVTIAVMMGADRIDAQNDLLNVIVLEKELIQLSLSEADHRNNTYYNNNYMTVSQMQIFAPNIDWIQYFTEIIGRNIDPKMEVIVLIPTYIRKLNQKIAETDHRILANYLIWRVIFKHIPFLSKRLREPLNKYFLNNKVNYKEEDRWRTCLKQIQNLMPYPLGNIYMKKHFNNRKDIEVISMINNIKESFIQLIDKNEWMSDSVKAEAIEKVLLMELRIGFPKELLNEDLLDIWLKNVDIEQDYFKNTIKLSLFAIDEQMKNLFSVNDNMKLLWLDLVNPAEIVLRYSHEDNALLISAALINGLFNEDLPKYLNYGSIGLLISQEMVKIYDEMGRLFDHLGGYVKWWDKLSHNNYNNYINCYQKQIKDLDDVFREMSDRNRYQFIERLITDNTVFRQTILAYRRSLKPTKELCLVGLNHTSEQLFWINSVNTYLNTYTNPNNSYDFIKYRVNSVFSNIKEFSEAFNCSSVSTMNSHIKC